MSAGAAAATPSVTVVVCAYTEERWDTLAAVIGALATQTRAPDDIVVVIDHNDALLARCRATFTSARVLRNTGARGLSGARNTAIAAAAGDVIAFLDDDAVPASDWVELLLGGYADPDVMAVGGSARPVWPAGRPAHLVRELDWVVGCTYTGQPTTTRPVRNLMGCNMSFRRVVFDKVGGFDEATGRIGRVPLGCEETELCIRLGRVVPGSLVLFEPAATVDHHVEPRRTSWAYMRQRSYAEGLSKAYIATLVGASDATSAEREYTARVLPRAVLRELLSVLAGRPGGIAGAGGVLLALAAACWGYVRGSMDQRRGRDHHARLREAA